MSEELKDKVAVVTGAAAGIGLTSLARLHLHQQLSGVLGQTKEDGYEPVLKNSRWCLLKRPENLTIRLKELLQYNLRSVKAYLMREDFQRFWTYESPA